MRAILLAAALMAAPVLAERAGPSRADLAAMEKSLDDKLKRFSLDNPFNIIAFSSGMYVEGTGAMFSAEISLVPTPGLSPFRPELTQEEKQRLLQTKRDRLPALKQMMRNYLVACATSLDRLPPEEQVAVGIKLFYHPWEMKTGLPDQVVMWGQKKPLVDVAAGRIDRAELETLVKVREF